MGHKVASASKAICVNFIILLSVLVAESKDKMETARKLPISCGNGNVQIQQSEQCDDGNYVEGDGCSSTCQIEYGWTCNGAPSVCQKCGNGKIEGTEVCDDGNSSSGDGCSSSCTLETGWTCNGAVLSICQKCGNGIKEGTEVCDDGNINIIFIRLLNNKFFLL